MHQIFLIIWCIFLWQTIGLLRARFLVRVDNISFSALAEIRGIVVDTNMLAVVPKRTSIETCKISLIILNIIDESVRHTFNMD